MRLRLRLRLLVVASVLAALVAVPIAVSSAARRHSVDAGPIYLNRSYSPAERATDLVSRMALAEKASQIHFTRLYSAGASLSNVKVGLFAWDGPATTSDLKVSFQHFHVG